MKRIFGALLALFSVAAFGATLVPVQLLNPTGSTSGQAIVSTGGSSAPSWSATLGGITFTGTSQVSDSAPVFAINDTSGTSASSLFFNNTGTGKWAWTNTSSTSAFTLGRYVSGTFTDNPISVSNSTGIVTMVDGISGTPISGSTGSFTTLAASGAVSGTGFSNYFASPPNLGLTAPASGKFTTLSTTSTFAPNTIAGIVGTTTNDSAQAGSEGETICAQVTNGGSPSGCATNTSTPTTVSTTNTATNVTSISLTAGQWDVCGEVITLPAGTTTVTGVSGWISTTSNTLPTGTSQLTPWYFMSNSGFTTGQGTAMPLGCTFMKLASTTTVYLETFIGFGVSTMSAYGWIEGIRRR